VLRPRGGAVGTLRSQDPAGFEPTNDGDTRVRLSSDLAVGGILGALGHKLIVSKSREITEKFARALQVEIQSATAPGA
jgi:carbon monoxide dehydrogenase subunit G